MSESISVLRHSARGCLNAVKLCVSALELDCTRDEQIEFLNDVINSSDQLCGVIEELAVAFDAQGVAESNHI
jgi:hypothetical protein